MRSIIFTSALSALAGTAAAQEFPQPGCYARDYDAAHLANHPEQVINP
ncbi:MAG: hypothetical protein AAFW87_13110 [Pseudomonadota bacterium]